MWRRRNHQIRFDTRPRLLRLDGNKRKAILARDAAAISEAVIRACQNKAEVVAADEREHGERALLNLGHTFGHAIETGLGTANGCTAKPLGQAWVWLPACPRGLDGCAKIRLHVSQNCCLRVVCARCAKVAEH